MALMAFSVIAAACSSSDEETPLPPAVAATQSDEPTADTPLDDGDESTAPSESPAASGGAQQAQAEEDADAPGAQAQSDAEADEQAVVEDEPEAEEQAAGDGAEDAASNAGDGAVAASGGSLQLGDLGGVEDLRFEGTLVLDVVPNVEGGDLDLSAFGDVVLEGAFAAPADFEVSIRLGAGSAFPPLGIVSVGDTLYTNLGFGWEAQEGGAGGLLDLFGGLVDTSAFGLDADALDVDEVQEGGLEGIGGLLPEDFSLDSWGDEGIENLATGPARRFTIESDELDDFIQRLAGDALEAISEDDSGLDLSAIEDFEGTVDSARVSIWIDEATGTFAALSLEIANLAVADIDDEGNGLSIGLTRLEIVVDPAFGLPMEITIVADDLDVAGPDGLSGSIRFDFRVFDLNAGTDSIEAPI